LQSLTADIQQRALLPPSASLSNQQTPANLNQDQSSDEDIFDDSDTDDENLKKNPQLPNKKSMKLKTTKLPTDDSNSNINQTKRLLNSIFPSTNDIYGFQLDNPSLSSLQCYEQYAKMAHNACLLAIPSPLTHQHNDDLTASTSSLSSYEM